MPDFDFTVLVCTKDRPRQLVRCLEALLTLRHDAFEVIVVDNGSRNFEIPELAYTRPTRFYSYPLPGLSAARNAVIREIKGKILALVDDDAVAHSEWLRSAANSFASEQIGCVTGKILPLREGGEWQEKLLSSGWFPQSDQYREFDLSNFDPLAPVVGAGSNLFIRMNILEKVRFPELFGPGTPALAADEMYLFYQVIKLGVKIVYNPEAIVYHEFADSKEHFDEVILKGSISRGAYLTKFLFTESGYRMAACRYILAKGSNNGPAAKIRRKGLLLGPVALLRSALRSHNQTPATFLRAYCW